MSAPHLSVLFDEIIEAFSHQPIHTFVDGTLGAAGHAQGVLEAHPEIQRFIGIDQDSYALEIAAARLSPWIEKLTFVKANFSQLTKIAGEQGIGAFDGILLDLGVSSMQLDVAERGFSINRPGPLDMRMNPDNPLTAAEIVNTWSEAELGRIFRNYSEEKRWRRAAHAIVQARTLKPFETTQDLVDLLMPILRDPRSAKSIHPLTLVFQGLRIAVNEELDVLKTVLEQAVELLAPGGRLAVISFHSLEDRMAKQFFSYLASDKESTRGNRGVFLDKKPIIKLVTRKPLAPSDAECMHNPRSRSAKLRIVEKL